MYELVVFITWMTSPIFYPEQIVPERLRFWVHINPIAAIANDIRDIAFGSASPDIRVLAFTVGLAIAALIVGAVIFMALQRWAMDLL